MKIESPSGAPPGDGASLSDWLAYIERQHAKTIDMGLDRLAAVRDRMALAPQFAIITVGGTNGKGSTCAMLESILRAGGYRVGCYTSPHLLQYNERVRLDRVPVADDVLCESFAAVERARAGVPLTYFEFGTLAAVWVFARAGIDVAVLEVGLGGRLDAVNLFDADCAVITAIGMDHMDYLGPTRDSIGREKAGIFRAGRPAVLAEPDVPATMERHLAAVGARRLHIDDDFRFSADAVQWRYEGPGGLRAGLPFPALRGRYQLSNAAAAITAIDALRDRLPVASSAIRQGLVNVELPGRFQVLPGRPVTVLDVAHNPHAAERLADALGAMETFHETHAVFAMLRDKDIEGVVRAVKGRVDRWYLAPLAGPRGADAPTLQRALDAASVFDPVTVCASVSDALESAQAAARLDDRIVAFGSFLTVAQALSALSRTGR
ncbi:MAG: bifunctional tetrahydrofolate synthase/dihydrofolate synthase [Burkholderiales bacterium]|nr:bifunctional tetrahydrofolate synthase/dihydrofolate synthase [Burkholderiales bacterium]